MADSTTQSEPVEPAQERRFLTTPELAARWRTTAAGILNQRHRGTTPIPTKIGGRLLWPLDVVEAFEDAASAGPDAA